MTLRVLGIDVGVKNTALALVEFTPPEALAETPGALLRNCEWRLLRAENLHLSGGAVSGPLMTELYGRLSQPAPAAWGPVDVVVVEQQNGHYSPQNYALQAALQMWAHTIAPRVVTVNNAHKLHRMARYGMIPDRTAAPPPAKRQATLTGALRVAMPPPLPMRPPRATHHFNKKDVVEWVRTLQVPHPEIAEMLDRNADKEDDVCDALTHALSWCWEQCESRALQKLLQLTAPRRRPPAKAARVSRKRSASNARK
jgi:hypothetical protein